MSIVREFPTDLGIPPLEIKNLLESKPPKSRCLTSWTGRAAVAPCVAAGTCSIMINISTMKVN